MNRLCHKCNRFPEDQSHPNPPTTIRGLCTTCAIQTLYATLTTWY